MEKCHTGTSGQQNAQGRTSGPLQEVCQQEQLPALLRQSYMNARRYYTMHNTKLKSSLATKAQALQETSARSEQDSLVPAQSGYAALTGSTLDLIRENLKDQPLTYQMFDVVKSPSGGSTVFTVPGLAGDEAEKELTGIIQIGRAH